MSWAGPAWFWLRGEPAWRGPGPGPDPNLGLWARGLGWTRILDYGPREKQKYCQHLEESPVVPHPSTNAIFHAFKSFQIGPEYIGEAAGAADNP